MKNSLKDNEEFFNSTIKHSNELLDLTNELLEQIVEQPTTITPNIKESSSLKTVENFIQIPKGSFIMGSDDYIDEQPRHRVTINYNLAISKYQVSIKEYLEFVQSTRSNYPEWLNRNDKKFLRVTTMTHYKNINLNDDAPIVGVSWENAKAYCRWLSQKNGKNYRLPTEAEWEYACRAASSTRYNFGDDENLLHEYAWYNKNSNGKNHAIGVKKPNNWGLYDMHGNVWEWCEDVWVDNYETTPKDGSANKIGNEKIRVLRGGSWVDSSRYVRSTNRNGFDADGCDNDLGFRLATLNP